MPTKGQHLSVGYESIPSYARPLSKLLESLEKPAPTRLHHYTNADGLIGILEKKVIYSSHVSSLNDLGEFSYDSKTFFSMLERRTGSIEPVTPFTPSRPGMRVSDTQQLEYFVTSFCERGDVIPMWRGYAGSGSGYALGVDSRSLGNAGNGYLLPVIYGDRERDAAAERLVNTFIKVRYDAFDSPDWAAVAHVERALFIAIRMLASSCKSEDFAYEEEWRLITPLDPENPNSNQYVKFRNRAGLLVPYVEHPLPVVGGSVDVRSLMCGPSLLDRETVRFAELLLWKYGVPSSIEVSKIKMR